MFVGGSKSVVAVCCYCYCGFNIIMLALFHNICMINDGWREALEM